MRAFAVFGPSKSGKTTTVECLLAALRKRGYSVATLKDIHGEGFEMDRPGTDTYRHREAGSYLVVARSPSETDFILPRQLAFEEIFKAFQAFNAPDFVIVEGGREIWLPKILCARAPEDVEAYIDGFTFCISGVISGGLPGGESPTGPGMESYGMPGLPLIDARKEPEKLVELIEAKVYDLLPHIEPGPAAQGCGACGMSCEELGKAILRGERTRVDCRMAGTREVELTIGGRPIEMIPFVERILKGTVIGLVSNLKGYKDGEDIEVRIRFWNSATHQR
mgnify:CR=1 FL=1